MKNKFEIFLDTDIFTEHLYGKNSEEISVLHKCTILFKGCYTSVVNVSEIFAECSGERMFEKAKKSFNDIGILGIPFRYSLKIGEVMRAIKKKERETLIGMQWL